MILIKDENDERLYMLIKGRFRREMRCLGIPPEDAEEAVMAARLFEY